MMNRVVIEPMGMGRILDISFQLFRQKLKVYLLISLVGNIANILFYLISGILALTYSTEAYENTQGVVSLIGAIPLGIFYVFMTAALISATNCFLNQEEVTVGKAFRLGAGRFWALVGTGLLYILGIFFGLLLFIIPGIFLMVRWFLNPQAVMMENVAGTKALGRSKELVKGYWWRSFWFVIVVGIITGVASGIVVVLSSLAASVAGNGQVEVVMTNFLTPLVTVIVSPYSVIAATLYYFELRARKEGWDLEQSIGRLEGDTKDE
ncbi:hypothetical protein [Candidatus Formimonas warabiya]|nr:hypothetical protein [Candidatus Formimonas warabiya]